MTTEAATGGVPLKKCVFKNFAKFTGKHLSQSLFLNKVGGLRPAILLRKTSWHRCFPVNFAKFLLALFFGRTPLVAASVTNQFIETLNTFNWHRNLFLGFFERRLFSQSDFVSTIYLVYFCYRFISEGPYPSVGLGFILKILF